MDLLDTWGHRREPKKDWHREPHVIVSYDDDGHYWAHDVGEPPTRAHAELVADGLVPN